MSRKTLLDTNPYLADPKLRAKMIHLSVVTSTAIEGVNLETSKTFNRIRIKKKK